MNLSKFQNNYLVRKYNELPIDAPKSCIIEITDMNGKKLSVDLIKHFGKITHHIATKAARKVVLIDAKGNEQIMDRQSAIDFLGTENITTGIRRGVPVGKIKNRFTGEFFNIKYL